MPWLSFSLRSISSNWALLTLAASAEGVHVGQARSYGQAGARGPAREHSTLHLCAVCRAAAPFPGGARTLCLCAQRCKVLLQLGERAGVARVRGLHAGLRSRQLVLQAVDLVVEGRALAHEGCDLGRRVPAVLVFVNGRGAPPHTAHAPATCPPRARGRPRGAAPAPAAAACAPPCAPSPPAAACSCSRAARCPWPPRPPAARGSCQRWRRSG